MLDKVTRTRDRLITALVAVHALAIEELRALRLDDHDPVRGTLTVHRGGLVFTMVLDELVARCSLRGGAPGPPPGPALPIRTC